MTYPSQISGLPLAEYLRLQALSAGVINTLVERCPAAAWHESPWNTLRVPDSNGASDKGTIAHEILLEGSEECVAVIDPRDYPTEKTGNIPDGWTNKAIRLARDNARAQGKVPILAGDMEEIRAMVGAASYYIESLRKSEPAIWRAFQPDGGESELTILWEEDSTLCRARPDRISRDRELVVHVKTTGSSAEPESWGRRHLFGEGYYVSAAWYRRGCLEVFGVDAAQVFLVVEQSPPHLCSLVGVDPRGMELGASKVETGLREWRDCTKRKHWPAYPNRVAYMTTPEWEVARFEAREVLSFEERLLLGSQA